MSEDWNEFRRRGGREGTRLFLAVGLIAVGTLLFLGNLGILPVRAIWSFWPVVLIVLGVGRIVSCKVLFGKFFGIALIVFGTLFLLINLNVLHLRTNDDSWPLSMLLITFGMGLLMKRLDAGGANNWSWRRRKPAGDYQNSLSDWVVFGSIKRRMDTSTFEGGDAMSVFGSVEIDLRRAIISPATRTVTVEANAVFGEVKLRVAEGWKVNIAGVGVLGAFEDKTIPPITPDDAPVLIVTGVAVFGAVTIVD
jgi:predicted membrane protein